MPTAEEEAKDETAADLAFEAAASWLREHTRDKSRLGLLFQRNVDYGFRRNLTGLRRVALLLDAMLCAVAVALLVAWYLGVLGQNALPPPRPKPSWSPPGRRGGCHRASPGRRSPPSAVGANMPPAGFQHTLLVSMPPR
jgi:hypothetical protein